MKAFTPKDLVLENQFINEEKFGEHAINRYIADTLHSNPEVQDKVTQGLELIGDWLSGTFYESKENRLNKLRTYTQPALTNLIWNIFLLIARTEEEQPFTTVLAQLTPLLKWDSPHESALTMGELLAILADTDAFDIYKPATMRSTLYIRNRLPIPNNIRLYQKDITYLPPMLVKPKLLRHNKSSGYLTIKEDSLILGKDNHHDRNICLDVLNIMNSVELQIDKEFLSTLEEPIPESLETQEQIEQALAFKKQSYYFYARLVNQGDKIYFTHKVDKRGRIYCQGYHLNTQGTSFKKALIELYRKEYVDITEDFM